MKKLGLILFLLLSYYQFCFIRGQDEHDYEDYDAEDDDDIVYVHYPINRCPEHVKAHITAFINTIRWEKGVEPVHLNSRLNTHAHELTKSKNRPKPDDDESLKSYTCKTEIGPFNGMIFEVDVSEALDNLSDEDIGNRDFKWIGVGCKTSYRKDKRWIHLAVVLGGTKFISTTEFSNPVERIELTSKFSNTTNSTKIGENVTSNSNFRFSNKTFHSSIPPVLKQTSDNYETEEISSEPLIKLNSEKNIGRTKFISTTEFSNPVKTMELTSKFPSTTNSTKIEGNDTSNKNFMFSTKTFLTSIPPVRNQTSDNEEAEEISSEPEIDREISTPIFVNEIAVTENLSNLTVFVETETDEFETTSDALTSSSQLHKSLTNASVVTIQSLDHINGSILENR